MRHPLRAALPLALTAVLLTGFGGTSIAQNVPSENGIASAPDEWLLNGTGRRWWYRSQPSPLPKSVEARAPRPSEQALVARAESMLAATGAKAIVLMEGGRVVYQGIKAPASEDSHFFGFSMGKTVTAMSVGQAICAGHLSLSTKAADLMPELQSRALGKATVRDLLTMSSGAAEPNADSTIFTREQNNDWNLGVLNLVDVIASERVSKASRGLFSEHKPGEHFSYKTTDPLLLGMMVARATGMPYRQWLQTKVIDAMGAGQSGLIVQDQAQNAMSDSGVRLRLEDWIRFADWVRVSSTEPGCFGDFVRAALSTQIKNASNPAARKSGRYFDGYGYLTWTENTAAPESAWANGWGGQRIGWHKRSNRIVIAFSNSEGWIGDFYALAKDWYSMPPGER